MYIYISKIAKEKLQHRGHSQVLLRPFFTRSVPVIVMAVLHESGVSFSKPIIKRIMVPKLSQFAKPHHHRCTCITPHADVKCVDDIHLDSLRVPCPYNHKRVATPLERTSPGAVASPRGL